MDFAGASLCFYAKERWFEVADYLSRTVGRCVLMYKLHIFVCFYLYDYEFEGGLALIALK